ncbi:hypothetical protein QUB63_11355 [Microcoleus sp. ARI1-B5]|uniref:hypothetical protein n=1 Tax=unclassified Microcoleus TaxID=2642155 RepID=UPI002FD1D832
MSRSPHDICHGRSHKGRVFSRLAIERYTIEVDRLKVNCQCLCLTSSRFSQHSSDISRNRVFIRTM